jgi:3-hydroxyisobutyrate dehydrogenase
MALQKIAFIGLGQMGTPMGAHLVKAGYRVVGFDLSEAARQSFAQAGAEAANTIEEALSDADYVITMLPNGKIVQSALLDNQAFLRTKKGAILLEMSSSEPGQTVELSKALGAHIRMLDCPVSGGVKRAVEGTLTIMVGGDPALKEEAEPVLQAMAAKIFYCGTVGAGHAMKAINNFVSGAGLVAAVEALNLGKAFGIEGERIVDVLNASSGKNNATEVKMKQFVLSGTFGSGFAMGLMAKDIRIAANLSSALGLDQPSLRQTADLWQEAAEKIGGQADHTRFYDFALNKQQ